MNEQGEIMKALKDRNYSTAEIILLIIASMLGGTAGYPFARGVRLKLFGSANGNKST